MCPQSFQEIGGNLGKISLEKLFKLFANCLCIGNAMEETVFLLIKVKFASQPA